MNSNDILIGGLGQASQRGYLGMKMKSIFDRQRQKSGHCCCRKQREDGWKDVM